MCKYSTVLSAKQSMWRWGNAKQTVRVWGSAILVNKILMSVVPYLHVVHVQHVGSWWLSVSTIVQDGMTMMTVGLGYVSPESYCTTLSSLYFYGQGVWWGEGLVQQGDQIGQLWGRRCPLVLWCMCRWNRSIFPMARGQTGNVQDGMSPWWCWWLS